MKTAILVFLRVIFLPFLIFTFFFKYVQLLWKAKNYVYQKDTESFSERFERVAKLVRFYLYLRGIQVSANFAENLSSRRSVLFTCNHKSWLDPLILINAIYPNSKKKENFVPFTFIAKIELKKKSIGRILSYLDCVFIDRKNLRQVFESFSEQSKLIKNDISICVFPEGTRVQTDELGEFKVGSIKIALKNFIPIIPTAIYSSKKLNQLSRFNFLQLKPIKVSTQFGEPIDTFQYADANPDFLVNNLREKIYIMYKNLKRN